MTYKKLQTLSSVISMCQIMIGIIICITHQLCAELRLFGVGVSITALGICGLILSNIHIKR